MTSRVFVCSPLRSPRPAGFVANQERARFYCKFVMESGHRPFAPHLFYTQILDDHDPADRAKGMAMGLEDLAECAEVWAFGFPTEGMLAEVKYAESIGVPVRRFTAECMPINVPPLAVPPSVIGVPE